MINISVCSRILACARGCILRKTFERVRHIDSRTSSWIKNQERRKVRFLSRQACH